MAKKTRKRNEDIESYRHEADTRKNAVPVGLASYDDTMYSRQPLTLSLLAGPPVRLLSISDHATIVTFGGFLIVTNTTGRRPV